MDFLIHLDHTLFIIINQKLASSWQDAFFPFITDLHRQVWFKLIFYPVILAIFSFKYKKLALIYFLFCLLSVGVTDFTGNVIFKRNVERQRPFEVPELKVIKRSSAHGQSFISNHSANMFAFATFASAFIPAGRFLFFAFAGIIAYSRVYNGVHFPLDVACGSMWCISISLLFILLAKWTVKKLTARKESLSV